MKTTIVSQTSGYLAPVLPVLLCAPKYLDGSMSLGQVMQAASAFTIVQTPSTGSSTTTRGYRIGPPPPGASARVAQLVIPMSASPCNADLHHARTECVSGFRSAEPVVGPGLVRACRMATRQARAHSWLHFAARSSSLDREEGEGLAVGADSGCTRHVAVVA
jgi:hypothetical protein